MQAGKIWACRHLAPVAIYLFLLLQINLPWQGPRGHSQLPLCWHQPSEFIRKTSTLGAPSGIGRMSGHIHASVHRWSRCTPRF